MKSNYYNKWKNSLNTQLNTDKYVDLFNTSDALIFDGTKPFPSEAIEKQKELNEQLKDRAKELKKQKEFSFLKNNDIYEIEEIRLCNMTK